MARAGRKRNSLHLQTQVKKLSDHESRTYKDVGDDWIFPYRKEFRLMCCDCKLVHVFKWRLVRDGKGHRIEFKCDRDERATAQARRHRAKPVS